MNQSKIKIHSKFRPLFEEKTRYYIITGERGSGKSYTVSLWLTYKLLQENQNILYTRFTLSSAKDSIIPEFIEKIDLINAANKLQVNVNDIFNQETNSDIKFRGIKTSQGIQTAKLKSLTGINIWVLDEAEELTDESVFDKIDNSIRQKDKTNIVILILNPTYRKHFIFKRFFRNANVKENSNLIKGDVTYIHVTYLDNKDNLDPKWVAVNEKLKQENYQLWKKSLTAGWLEAEEGLGFPDTELNYFNPEKTTFSDWDIILCYIDTADKGQDFYSMPVARIVNGKIYIIDVIYNQNKLTHNEPITVSYLQKYKPSNCVVETNKEGSLYIGNLRKQVKNITFRGIFNTTNKDTRIRSELKYIIDNFYFIQNPKPNTEYFKFIENLTEWELNGKNENDDAPDSLAGLSKFIRTYIIR